MEHSQDPEPPKDDLPGEFDEDDFDYEFDDDFEEEVDEETEAFESLKDDGFVSRPEFDSRGQRGSETAESPDPATDDDGETGPD